MNDDDIFYFITIQVVEYHQLNYILSKLLMKNRKASHNQVASDRIFIGVAGGSAAGKTTLCENINRQMAFDRNFKVQTISLDSFYKSINKHEVDVAEYNFDHPLALDFELAYDVLLKLKYSNEPVAIPQYSFVEHQRLAQPAYVYPANIILFEGLMAFHDQRIRNMMTYKIFINCDDDIRLCRRIKRDTTERGRTIVGVLLQYNKFVKNAFRDFIYPTIGYADLVIPGSRNNRISVDFIVQHIKNVARKKNIFKNAQDTKVFLFGQNQYFDMSVKKNYKDSIQISRQSFLIFPTSDQHRRQLDFFLNVLMSEAFTQDYFEEVYIYQFMKIVKSLLRQLFELKNFKTSNMQLISIFEIRERLKKDSKKPIKIVFVPIIFEKQQNFLNFVKPLLKQKETLIIINLFCDMLYPTKIYQSDIEGLIFLNLYLVANKKRLLDILSANNLNIRKNQDQHKYPRDWLLYNRQLVEKGLTFLGSQFGINYQKFDWKMQEQLFVQSIHSESIKNKEQLYTYPISSQANTLWEDSLEGRKIYQIQTLPQQHPNLCGYYALSNIKEYPNLHMLRSKQTFLQNYLQFTHSLQSKNDSLKYLKQKLFEPLERHSVPYLVYDHQLFDNKQICPLYISQNYIINERKTLKDIMKSLLKLKNSQIHELYFLMGVFNHYFVLRLTDPSMGHHVDFIDSCNTPIVPIMNGQCTKPNATTQDIKKIHNMKTGIQTVLQMYYGEQNIEVLLVRLRIKQILESYYKQKQSGRLSKWLEDQYPVKVIENDLFNQMRDVNRQQLGEAALDKITQWFNQEFVQQNIVKLDSPHHPLKKFRLQFYKK